jgi:UDP-3-O-[3-hydroxymyristoyl] N-acetylglucosamine deacetylase
VIQEPLKQPILPLSPFLPRQKTLACGFQCSGIGVHSGAIVHLSVLPAAPHAGITFVRIDKPELIASIPARFNNVVSTMMSTTLANSNGVNVSTVEHLMAALYGLGITNATIEVDAPEIPIMDGSAAVFAEHIVKAGITAQEEPVRGIEILKPVSVENKHGTVTFLPYNERLISFTFTPENPFYNLSRVHSFTFHVGNHDFENLADARTFGFYEDGEKLKTAGLAKGSSLDNTVVFKESTVMNPRGLRSADELVRHKTLDAIGDLALSGVAIYGHFKGINSGHGLNNKLLHTLFSTPEAWRFIEL